MEKSKEMLKMERHYERVNGNAPGRNFLLVAGIIHLVGVFLSAIVLIGPLHTTLQLDLSFTTVFGLVLTVGLVVLQLIIGVACIMWRNSIGKSNILFIMAITIIALHVVATFVALAISGVFSLNLIGLVLPIVHLIGASKNRKIWKEQEEKRIFTEIRKTM